jgi:hypothetical protein
MNKTAVLAPLLAIFLCLTPAVAGSTPKVAEDSDGSVLLVAYPPKSAHAHAAKPATVGKAAKAGKHAKAGKPVKAGKQARVGKHGKQAKAVAHPPAAKSTRHAAPAPKTTKKARVHAAVTLPGAALS